MSRECVISLKFSEPGKLSGVGAGLVLTVLLFCLFTGNLGSETLIVSTYYPAPYGGYVGILTTGRSLLARDEGSVGIGPSDLTKPAPNGLPGNLYANDIYLRAGGEWVSRLPIFTTYTTTKWADGLQCLTSSETLVAAGCKAGWSFDWGPIDIGWCPVCIKIPKIKWGIVCACGTLPYGRDVFGMDRMAIYSPALPPSSQWITCIQ